eukprot:2718474-Prymnesium_polylepis.1
MASGQTGKRFRVNGNVKRDRSRPQVCTARVLTLVYMGSVAQGDEMLERRVAVPDRTHHRRANPTRTSP